MSWFDWFMDRGLEYIEGLLKIGLLILMPVIVVYGCWGYHKETRRSAYMQLVDTTAEFIHAASYSAGAPIVVCHYGTFEEMMEFERMIKREGVSEKSYDGVYFLDGHLVYHTDGHHVTRASVDQSCPDSFYFELIYDDDGSLRIIKEISKGKYFRIVEEYTTSHS